MSDRSMSPARRMRPAWLVPVLLALPLWAWAQAFPIVPPKLAPRAGAQAAGAAPVAPQAQTPAAQPPATAYGQAPAQPYAQTGTQPYAAPAPAAYGQAGAPAAAYAPQAPAAYAPQAQAAYAPQTGAGVATPAAPAGACRVQPSPERQTLSLVSGEPPLPREHVPLGEFRSQLVVHSPDGRWAVAFTKLRGAAQFAALTFNLERCKPQRTVELPGAGSDAEFQGDDAVIRYAGGERRISLRDGSVR